MSTAVNLWAMGFDEAERAAQVGDEITKLAWMSGDPDVILRSIRGLGGIELKSGVDRERARPIQAQLAARNE